MQGFYYITAAMVLVLGGLGIYSSQAGTKVVSEPEGVIVMEEVVYTVSPKRQNQPTKATDINAMKNNNSKGGFMIKLKQILKYIISSSECRKCNRYQICDCNTWKHRTEDDCEYGKIHGR